ncbi:MAG TPA: hypothetical protein VJ001_11200 [Rhodocyclaceae bacterium]|nr:hypothetical protein [Rhodocyclaceae bacterium]
MANRTFPICALAILHTAALAQVPDPTRPATLSATAPTPGGVDPTLAAGSGLQAVILKRHGGGKSAAVIDGRYVELGGKVGERRVRKITENSVVLQGERDAEVLKLIPAAEKIAPRKATAKKPPTNRANPG